MQITIKFFTGRVGLIKRLLPVVFLSCVSFLISWNCSRLLIRDLIMPGNENVWFDADAQQYYSVMCSRWTPEHYRARRHPLFALFATPAVWGINKLLAIEQINVIRILLGLNSFIVTCLVYILLLSITSSTVSAFAWTMLYQISVSHLFWCGVPETFAFGGLSILLPFVAVVLFGETKWSYFSLLIGMFFSFAISITNIMSGIACAILTLPVRKAWEMIKTVLCLSVVGLALQSKIIPPTVYGIWFIPNISGELQWTNSLGNHECLTRAFLISTAGIIAPEAHIRDKPLPNTLRCGLTAQGIRFHMPGKVCCFLWFLFLIFGALHGCFHTYTNERSNIIFRALVLVGFGQILLHIIYGWETILYSAHYGPVFLLLSAFSCRVLPRMLAVTLVAGLFCLVCANNLQVFFTSLEYLHSGRG